MRTELAVVVFSALSCAACPGTVDTSIEVRGRIVDEHARPYALCNVLLYRGSEDEVLQSEKVEGESFRAWFTVSHSMWIGIEIGVECEGARQGFRSERIGWWHEDPADLGTVELRRGEDLPS